MTMGQAALGYTTPPPLSLSSLATLEKKLAELENLLATDPLTGLKNRRGFAEAFAREVGRSKRFQSHGGLLVVIDLDNFAQIKMVYGQLAGQACLRLVGKTLAHEIRPADVAARFEGDEFVLLLADAKRDEALSRVQTLAWHLNNLSLAWNGEEIPICASVGVKPYSSGDRAETIFEGIGSSPNPLAAAPSVHSQEGESLVS